MTANLFSELALKPQLLARLNAMGFDTMTPVQEASLPSLMAGKDVIAQASTGSGKTAAFALACLQRLLPAAFCVQLSAVSDTRIGRTGGSERA